MNNHNFYGRRVVQIQNARKTVENYQQQNPVPIPTPTSEIKRI